MIALKLCVNLDNLDYSSIICRRVHLYADDECFYNGKHSSNGFTAASRPANVIFESIQIWIPVAVTILSFIHICIYTRISHVCAHVCVCPCNILLAIPIRWLWRIVCILAS